MRRPCRKSSSTSRCIRIEQIKRIPSTEMFCGRPMWKSNCTVITTAEMIRSEICKQATKMAFEKAKSTSSSWSLSCFLESQCSALKAITYASPCSKSNFLSASSTSSRSLYRLRCARISSLYLSLSYISRSLSFSFTLSEIFDYSSVVVEFCCNWF